MLASKRRVELDHDRVRPERVLFASTARGRGAYDLARGPRATALVSAACLTLLAVSCNVRMVQPSDAMEPTIKRGQTVVVRIFPRGNVGGSRGELLCFRSPDPQDRKARYVKRAVAIGGDTIESRGGTIYLNGGLLTESYVSQRPAGPLEKDFGPVTVPVGTVFVMNDNRGVPPWDSRLFGPIPISDVLGTVRTIR